MEFLRTALSAAVAVTAFAAFAADYPAPKEADWIARDFKFHTGETMPELRLHYTTIGVPTGQPVLVLHGSGGSAANMLTPAFAGELFGPGQPLDASKYYIIIPDGIGHGKSSKPSDGMKTAFPKYDYDDMVDAHYRLVTEGLGVKHLRLVIGNSMGGMHTWIWGVKYPDMMDALVPMASQPTAMAARNWMLRRMMLETIRNDPDYNGGQLHGAAAHDEIRHQCLPDRDRRRHARLPDAGAHRGQGRQDGGRAAGDVNHGRCQRLRLSMGSLARLRSVGGHGEDRGNAAGDQCRRRRAQPAGNRRHRGRDQAHQERQALSDPGRARRRAAISPPATRDSTRSSCRNCCKPRRSERCRRRVDEVAQACRKTASAASR